MVALVLVDVSEAAAVAEAAGIRLDIFPGGPIPAVFPAETPFWVGYGFAPDAAAPGSVEAGGDATRFELAVDEREIGVRSHLMHEGGTLVRKTVVAGFPSGLPAGWHVFTGRWYDHGRLLLSSRATIEFVEP
jgi:hypothetical protein